MTDRFGRQDQRILSIQDIKPEAMPWLEKFAEDRAENPKTVADLLLMCGLPEDKWKALCFRSMMEGGPDMEQKTAMIGIYHAASQHLKLKKLDREEV